MNTSNQAWMGVLATALAAAPAVHAATAPEQEASASGEVRRIDAAAGKITIKQGAISDLQLPAMTLVYRIDPTLLKDIHPGDKVHFTAARKGGQYVVTRISK